MSLQRGSQQNFWLTFFVSVISASIFLSGCTKTSPTPSDEVLIALSAPSASLDPRFATDATGMRISGLLFTALIHHSSDFKLIGDFAENWTYQHLAYRFNLKSGLQFANEAPVTADDILFSFSEFMKSTSPFASNFKNIDSVHAEYNDRQRFVEIKLKKFSASFLNDLKVVKILPKALIEKDPQAFTLHPVGSGSFKLLNNSSQEITLEARDHGTFAHPKIKKLTFKIVRDDYTRYLKLLKHELDIEENEVDGRRLAEFQKRSDEFQVYKQPGLSMSYMLINLRNPMWQKLDARKALAYAINRKDIIQYKLEGMALPATALISPIHEMFDKSLQSFDYDPVLAKQLVHKANLPGQKIVLKCSNAPSVVENARVIVENLKNAGLNIEVQPYEWGTFYGDVKAGHFDLALMKWVGLIDADIYRQAFHSHETPPGRNRGGYKNLEFDDLVEKALTEEDLEKRRALYHQAQQIIYQEFPIVPLWYEFDEAVVSSRIKNFRMWVSGDFEFANEIEKN